MLINRTLRHALPDASNHIYESRYRVLVWREIVVNNCVREWTGPFKMEGMNYHARIVYIRDSPDSPARPFSITHVNSYYTAEIHASSLISNINGFFSWDCLPKYEDDMFVTEVLFSDDKSAKSEEINEAKRKEINDIIRWITLNKNVQ